jgi:uncharacterized protein (DUF1697 family)
MNLYLALLRGINVGGKNLIKMAELAACFENLGFTEVRTYIQSGNVVFCAHEPDQGKLTGLLKDALSTTFNYSSMVVLRSYEDLKSIVSQAPDGFGSDPSNYRYDVIFIKEPLTSFEAIKYVSTKEGVDQAYAGNGVLYASRLISKASQSHLTRIIASPIYQSLSIRNWNTTTKLLKMMEATLCD